jgi:hypothetical protein
MSSRKDSSPLTLPPFHGGTKGGTSSCCLLLLPSRHFVVTSRLVILSHATVREPLSFEIVRGEGSQPTCRAYIPKIALPCAAARAGAACGAPTKYCVCPIACHPEQSEGSLFSYSPPSLAWGGRGGILFIFLRRAGLSAESLEYANS